MAKKQTKKTIRSTHNPFDFSAWNFVIFLTLAFMLIVFVVSALQGVASDVRAKAGLTCPTVSLPNPNACSTGWKLVTDASGCTGFVCETK